MRQKKEKKIKSKDQFQTAEESMESLHTELIMDILSRVPTLDLPKLRYVCKTWSNILKNPIFHRLHYTHFMFKPNENRVLVLKHSSELFFLELSDEMSPWKIAINLPCVPDNFSNYYFIGSCNGLLCLGRKKPSPSQIFVLNPFTRQHRNIPVPLKSDEYVFSWGFGFDEIAKLFKVIVLVRNNNNSNNSFDTEARACDLRSWGITNWRNFGIQNCRFSGYPYADPGCFVNGRLHWFCCENDSLMIVSLDLADEKFRLIPGPDDVLGPHGGVEHTNLTVFEGCLCIFHHRHHTLLFVTVCIMKEYGVKTSWVKIFDISPNILIPMRGRTFVLGFSPLGSVKDGELILLSSFLGSRKEGLLLSSNLTCSLWKLLPLEITPYPDSCIVHTCSLNWI